MNTINQRPDFRHIAKVGYLARGVVYLMIGGLAILAALGKGGETTDSKGAIVEIMQQPFGKVLLVLLTIGLIGFVIWRLVQSVKDSDDHGTTAKGIVIRGGLFASALSHGFLAWWTIKLLMGNEERSQSGQQFLSTDTGQIVIGIAGLAFLGTGLAHIYKGWTASFERRMKIPTDKNKWVKPLCQFGLISRGIVWCIVAWFCIRSVISARSGEIKGIVEALDLIRSSDYGIWLFGIVAAGLFAFGFYNVMQAFYRHIESPSFSSP